MVPIVRGCAHREENFVDNACGTWTEAATRAARSGARASAVRGGEQLGWSGGGFRQSASADVDGGDAALLFSDGGGGDRAEPDHAARGRALCVGASRVRKPGGFLTAWNLWVYGISITAAILYAIPTELAYLIGPKGAGVQEKHPASMEIV